MNSTLDDSDVTNLCKTGLQKYLDCEVLGQKEDPFVWWRTYSVLYPNLGILARKFLAVQSTSASSERIFGCASRIIPNLRKRLDPEFAGQLFYVSENMKWYDDNKDPVIGGNILVTSSLSYICTSLFC